METYHRPVGNASKERFCSRCGGVIDPDTKICTSCGKKYFKFSWKTATTIFVAVVILLLSSTVIYQYFESKDTISALSGKIAELEEQIESKKTEYENEISRLKDRLSAGFDSVYDEAYDYGYEQGKQHQENVARYFSIYGDDSVAAHYYANEMLDVTKSGKRNSLKDQELRAYLT